MKRKHKSTFLIRSDVEEAYLAAKLMSSHRSVVSVLFKELEGRILTNRETERQEDVTRWIRQGKIADAKNRIERKAFNDKLDDRKEAGEYIDINEYWFSSPSPTSRAYRGVEVCGFCWGRKEEPQPKGCHRSDWHEKNKKSLAQST